MHNFKLISIIAFAIGAIFLIFHAPLAKLEYMFHKKIGCKMHHTLKVYKIKVVIIGFVALFVGVLFLM